MNHKILCTSKIVYDGRDDRRKDFKDPPHVAYEKNLNVQDTFLNYVRKNRIQLTVFLINGVKLQGALIWFDQNTLLLRKEGYFQLIYKHAISTLMPHGHLSVFELSKVDSSNDGSPVVE